MVAVGNATENAPLVPVIVAGFETRSDRDHHAFASGRIGGTSRDCASDGLCALPVGDDVGGKAAERRRKTLYGDSGDGKSLLGADGKRRDVG